MRHDQVVDCLPNLRRYARALVGDAHAADDLVQDTLERALGKFHLWVPGNLRAWLFSIMHGVFVNQLKARRVGVDIEEAGIELAGAASGVETMIDLQAALLRLSPEHREVLLLVGLEDMSYRDTGQALGIPVGTVMSRLARARERLRQLMEGGESPADRPAIRIVK